MSTDGKKRPYFIRLFNAHGSRRLGPNYRLSKRVYSARAGQPLTAAYLFAPNSYRIAKLVRNAGYHRHNPDAAADAHERDRNRPATRDPDRVLEQRNRATDQGHHRHSPLRTHPLQRKPRLGLPEW